MALATFLASHPIFTRQEFVAYWNRDRVHSDNTIKVTLWRLMKQGRIVLIKSGLYGVVSPLDNSAEPSIDPYLIAAKLADDAILAYHTAIELYGKAYSTYFHFYYLSKKLVRTVQFRDLTFQRVNFPAALLKNQQETFGVQTLPRQSVVIKITSLERTLVDMLHELELSGGWEEVWRSFEFVKHFNFHAILQYLAFFNSAILNAKVGFYFSEYQKYHQINIDTSFFEQLKKHLPSLRSPRYLYRAVQQHPEKKREAWQLVKEWRLIVPSSDISQRWDELQAGNLL